MSRELRQMRHEIEQRLAIVAKEFGEGAHQDDRTHRARTGRLMTDNVVARLRELLDAAKPDPWEAEPYAGFTSGDMGWEIRTGEGEYLEGGFRSVFAPTERAEAELVAAAVSALPTLLSIVERFAAYEFPVDFNQNTARARLVCEWCDVDSDEGDWMEPMAFPHAPDCPWLAARRACGMEPANAEDGDA